ncbi:uncharacterized protein UTRI_04453_B [Ustilago trichophora]|uniref:SRR1-like domain-containing protein n=1 Tax=Ustilago trichophora TaxID=86804 RepID=A0A5C3EBR7_9BASI|nr:uncharacterized protein UTRI_04453_B [Ustilago trichophora]
MGDTQQEDQEAPFEYVKSRRRTKHPHRPPPTVTATRSGPSSSSSSVFKAGTSYSNSSGSITGSSSGGFTYSAASRSGDGKKRNKGRSRNGIVVVLSEEEEAQRAVKRAGEMVDVFVSKAAKQDGKGDTEESRNEEKEASKAKRKMTPAISSKIVCLGLGSPLTSKSAQVQLALLVVLRRWLSLLLGPNTHSNTHREEEGEVSESIATPNEAQREGSRDGRWEEVDQGRGGVECVAYDPVFTALDEVLLLRYGVAVARPAADTGANAEAGEASIPNPDTDPTLHRSIESHYTSIQTPTLLYMPHCDRELYEHILSLNYPPPPPSSSTPPPSFSPSQTIPIVLLSNVLTNYATFTSNLETSSPTLSWLMDQFTVVQVPNWDNGKRTALVEQGKQDDELNMTSESIGGFVNGWDRNALRDLAFHWL